MADRWLRRGGKAWVEIAGRRAIKSRSERWPTPQELALLEKVKQQVTYPSLSPKPLTPRESAKERAEEYVASRGLDKPVGTMSNLTARRAFNATLETKVRELSQVAEASASKVKKAENKAEAHKAEADTRFRERERAKAIPTRRSAAMMHRSRLRVARSSLA